MTDEAIPKLIDSMVYQKSVERPFLMGEHPFFIVITYEEFIFFMIIVTIFLCIVASVSAYRAKGKP